MWCAVKALVVVSTLACGCVLSPSPDADRSDANVNSAPAIRAVRADSVELEQYSTIVLQRGPSAGTLSVVVSDANVEDTLYVRIFVDYNRPDPTPPRSSCIATAGAVERVVTCAAEGICQVANIGQDPLPLLQVFVFDRDYDPDASPLFQGVASDGLSASQTFFLRCQEAQ